MGGFIAWIWITEIEDVILGRTEVEKGIPGSVKKKGTLKEEVELLLDKKRIHHNLAKI